MSFVKYIFFICLFALVGCKKDPEIKPPLDECEPIPPDPCNGCTGIGWQGISRDQELNISQSQYLHNSINEVCYVTGTSELWYLNRLTNSKKKLDINVIS